MSEKVEDLDVRFERFYAANYPRVKNFAKLLTKSEEDAEDIAQNIFLKLWTRPELWQDQETMTGYLYTVTRNEIFNLFKHQKVEQEYEDKVLKAQLLGELCDEDSSLLENLYYKEYEEYQDTRSCSISIKSRKSIFRNYNNKSKYKDSKIELEELQNIKVA